MMAGAQHSAQVREVRDSLHGAEHAAGKLDDGVAATSIQAFIGMGGNSISRWCGNRNANASSTPNTPPDAPTVGTAP